MKIKISLIVLSGAFILLSSCNKGIDTNAKINSGTDSLSYALGVDIGNSFVSANFEEINYNLLAKGLIAAMEDKDIEIPEEEIKPVIQKFVTEARNKKLEKNLEEGREFLEKNKEKEGIIVTESGLQYEVIEEGTGKSPKATDIVVCNYRGTLIDGTEFDSSYKNDKPAEFALNRVITGWTEGLQLMKEGAKYKFYIPTELGYGQRVRPGGAIEPNMALIFEVELLEVKAPEEKAN